VKYTVIGVHPDKLAHMGADEASYVEWVQAPTADAAVEVAKAVDHDRRNSLVVAVIPGHHVDQLFDKGLASVPTSICPSCGREGMTGGCTSDDCPSNNEERLKE